MGNKNVKADNGKHRASGGLGSGADALSAAQCLEIFRHMVRARALEERMIKMSKSGEGYFWIGGPGEEAFNVCLGLEVKKGEGPDFDYLHLHYRNSATLIAMGMAIVDSVRQMTMVATDTNSAGRNFPGHFARKDWNVTPVASVIGIQWVKGPGTAIVQKRHGGDGISIITGGDAGTHEGDFQSCLVWSTRPGQELPVLMIVMNNRWGISTAAETQHSEKTYVDRGTPFGIPGIVVDGNDPVASRAAIRQGMEHCRRQRSPFMIEAQVSRLYGHSSSSGAPRSNDPDCVALFEERLLAARLISKEQVEHIHEEARHETDDAVTQALSEPQPRPEDVEKFTYAPSPVDAVYPGDYTGMP